MVQMILFAKQKDTDIEKNICTASGERRRDEVDWEFEIDIYTLDAMHKIVN